MSHGMSSVSHPIPDRSVSPTAVRLLRVTLDEGDFFGREVVEFIDELVDLLVRGADSILEHRALGVVCFPPKRASKLNQFFDQSDDAASLSSVGRSDEHFL